MNKEVSLEQLFGQLDELVKNMEKEESLEASFQMYHQGIQMLKRCDEIIDKVEKQVMILDKGGEHVE